METLDTLFKSFETGIRSSMATKPRDFLKSIGLDYNDLKIGYNSGQFHHRISQEVKDQFEVLGVIKKSDAGVNKEDLRAYSAFGKIGVIFPLMNKESKIVNYFAIRFEMKTKAEEYLNNEGVYPAYPAPLTKRLYLVPTVLDCASLLQSKTLENRESVMALHDGELLPQHLEAIKGLHELEEIIIIKR